MIKLVSLWVNLYSKLIFIEFTLFYSILFSSVLFCSVLLNESIDQISIDYKHIRHNFSIRRPRAWQLTIYRSHQFITKNFLFLAHLFRRQSQAIILASFFSLEKKLCIPLNKRSCFIILSIRECASKAVVYKWSLFRGYFVLFN